MVTNMIRNNRKSTRKPKVYFIQSKAGVNAETGKTAFCVRWTDQFGKEKEFFYLDILDKHVKLWEDAGWTVEIKTTDGA